LHFAVFDVADHIFALIHVCQHFAAVEETPARQEIEPQTVAQPPQRIRLAAAVGDEPDFRHAAIIQTFLKIKSPELFLRCSFGTCRALCAARHYANGITHPLRKSQQNLFTPGFEMRDGGAGYQKLSGRAVCEFRWGEATDEPPPQSSGAPRPAREDTRPTKTLPLPG